MKIKEQARKLAVGCSKQCFEKPQVAQNTVLKLCSKHCFKVVDGTDEVCSKHRFEVVDEAVTYIQQGEADGFEEIFEEYKMMGKAGQLVFFDVYRLVR
ncbi:chlorohydrolase [Streptococcus pneumoniae]|uniref:hypothetical protein n=1 Tax=Streptococcus pneumoniae TaxID=1313 RepID=UPI000B589AF1|nr:hypothetical protein [Streptococcus pneumoniae]SNE55804.1 chlorohydrolase [Streptococcus pneumoniae]